MARTGRFGRQPRVAQSLTNTLVAIAREFQNQRAQNIMEAWQKGGMFEGKKATDDVVLAFWKNKMKGVSKDDPLYDTYKNAHTQLDYTISESKMTAGYATKKYTDAQMVNFYLGWAKKVPKDSEFYRVLQRDAGQYMRTVQATGEADRRAAQERRYQSQQADTRKGKERAGEYIIDTLRRIAQSGYVHGGIAPALDAPGGSGDLTDFDRNDPDIMLRLIAAIAPATGKPGSVEGIGNTDVLFHDDDRNPVTGVDIMNKLSKLDPNWSPGTPFDVKYITGVLDTQMQGLNERISRAKKTGHMTDVSSLLKSKGYVALLNREVAAYPVQKAYMEARADYDAIGNDPSSSPVAVLKAWEEYASTLTSLSNDPRIEADDNLRSRLIAEVNGTPGVPTLYESFTGLGAGQADPDSATDAAENAKAIEFMQQQVEAVASGAAVWTYGTLNSNGLFVPSAGGREIGAATQPAVMAGGVNAQMLVVDDPLGGQPITVAVTAVPIYATATDPTTGDPLDFENPPQPIGYAYDIPNGATTERQYGFQTKDGFRFSYDPPWNDELSLVGSSEGGKHLELNLDPIAHQLFGEPDPLTGQYPDAKNGGLDLTKNVDLGNGFRIQDAKPGKPGVVTFDGQAAAWATDTRDGLGTTDPATDFTSITVSHLLQTTDGMRILSNLDKYPAVRSQIENDNLAYAGAQRDPGTGLYDPLTADQTKLAAATGQMNIAVNAQSFSQFVADAGKTWQRIATGSPMQGGSKPAGAGFDLGEVGKLATDLLQGTPFEALGSSFQTGTSNLKQPDLDGQQGVAIKPGAQIKVPTMPDVSFKVTTQGVNPGAVSTQTTTQQGSAPPITQQGSNPPGRWSGKPLPNP